MVEVCLQKSLLKLVFITEFLFVFSEKEQWFNKYIKSVVNICGAHDMNSMKKFSVITDTLMEKNTIVKLDSYINSFLSNSNLQGIQNHQILLQKSTYTKY